MLIECQRKRDEFMQGLIEEHRRRRRGSDHDSETERKNSWIEVLLRLQESEPEYYKDEIIKGLVLVRFMSLSPLLWINFYLLIKHHLLIYKSFQILQTIFITTHIFVKFHVFLHLLNITIPFLCVGNVIGWHIHHNKCYRVGTFTFAKPPRSP